MFTANRCGHCCCWARLGCINHQHLQPQHICIRAYWMARKALLLTSGAPQAAAQALAASPPPDPDQHTRLDLRHHQVLAWLCPAAMCCTCASMHCTRPHPCLADADRSSCREDALSPGQLLAGISRTVQQPATAAHARQTQALQCTALTSTAGSGHSPEP